MSNIWRTAAARALATALIIGITAALATWTQTDSLKQIIIAGGTPALGILAARLGVEGTIDSQPK